MDTEGDVFYSDETVDYRLIFESGVRHGERLSIVGVRVGRLRERVLLKGSPVEHVSCYSVRRRKWIVGASEWQCSDGLYAVVLF
jgi:hypothetical protein